MDWNESKQTRKVLERALNELEWTQNLEKKYGKALEWIEMDRNCLEKDQIYI